MTHQITEENWRKAEHIVLFILNQYSPVKAREIVLKIKKLELTPCPGFLWDIYRVVYVLKRLRNKNLVDYDMWNGIWWFVEPC